MKLLRCFNCNEVGYFASACPSKPVRYSAVTHNKRPLLVGKNYSQIGQAEGKPVEIVLDTRCARTMVRKELVRAKITDRQISIHCAHGGNLTYPLATVK